jgi:hypothetical protein
MIVLARREIHESVLEALRLGKARPSMLRRLVKYFVERCAVHCALQPCLELCGPCFVHSPAKVAGQSAESPLEHEDQRLRLALGE